METHRGYNYTNSSGNYPLPPCGMQDSLLTVINTCNLFANILDTPDYYLGRLELFQDDSIYVKQQFIVYSH